MLETNYLARIEVHQLNNKRVFCSLENNEYCISDSINIKVMEYKIKGIGRIVKKYDYVPTNEIKKK